DIAQTPWGVLAELIEAAARAGEPQAATEAFADLSERGAAAGTDLAHGLVHRARALLAADGDAEPEHRAAVEGLGRATTRWWQARAHLVYGEWLRRERRRVDARDQLRAALGMFTDFGAAAFAGRARQELLATGERLRKRRDEPDVELTAQEEQIA